MLFRGQGLTVARESPHSVSGTPEMFDLSNYSDYDKWLNTFTEASARLDALETAVAEVRHLCESEGVFSNEQILEVLKRQGV